MQERMKGRSCTEFVNDYVLIDLETTGVNSRADKITEICAMKVRNNLVVREGGVFNTLINPGIRIPDEVVKLTGITNEMVANAPRFENIASALWDFLEGEIIVGYNVKTFDSNFLYDAFIQFGKVFNNDYIDLLDLTRPLIPTEKHRLGDICKYYDIGYDAAHRAYFDCVVTYNAYMMLRNDYGDSAFNCILFPTSKTHIGRPVYIRNDFDIRNKKFCLSGVFTAGESITLAKVLEKNGAVITKDITLDTDYLIMGDYDNPQWKVKPKGAKHRRANELIERGNNIQIINERIVFDIRD